MRFHYDSAVEMFHFWRSKVLYQRGTTGSTHRQKKNHRITVEIILFLTVLMGACFEPVSDSDYRTSGQRAADCVNDYLGTWTFVGMVLVALAAWFTGAYECHL
jgi:hypothetical protein